MNRRLTYEQLNARLYRGRQEGPLHRRVLDGLELAAKADRWVDSSSIKRESHLRSTVPDFHGRFPDLLLSARGRKFVFEVQTAPITVHRLIERGQFYKAASARLIWLTWRFDPHIHRNAWYWDMLAADFNTVFSLDDELMDRAHATNAISLRRFPIKPGENEFDVDLVGLKDLDDHLWALDLKERWIAAAGRDMRPAAVPLMELLDRAGISVDAHDELWPFAEATNALIAIEAGYPVGKGSANITGQVNAFLNSKTGRTAREIIDQALTHFQPERYKITKSLKDAVARANALASNDEALPAGNILAEKIGQMRDVLFPGWGLRSSGPSADDDGNASD